MSFEPTWTMTLLYCVKSIVHDSLYTSFISAPCMVLTTTFSCKPRLYIPFNKESHIKSVFSPLLLCGLVEQLSLTKDSAYVWLLFSFFHLCVCSNEISNEEFSAIQKQPAVVFVYCPRIVWRLRLCCSTTFCISFIVRAFNIFDCFFRLKISFRSCSIWLSISIFASFMSSLTC